MFLVILDYRLRYIKKTAKQKHSVDIHKAEKGMWDRMPTSCLDHGIHP